MGERNMANRYKVKVEVLEPGVEVSKEMQDGVECEGFALIAINGENESSTAFEHVIIEEIALAIAGSAELSAASVIARAYKEAHSIMAKDKLRVLADMFDKISED